MKTSARRKAKRQSGVLLVALGAIAVLVLLGGCASRPQPSPPALPSVPAPSAPPAPAEPARTEPPSRLSYGAITSTVKVGTTTQLDLLELFGGPNIATLDSDGMETWVYERTASETTSTTQHEATSATQVARTVTEEAKRLDLFFGLGFFGTGLGKGTGEQRVESTERTRASHSISHSIRTLTVIVKFNKDKTVKEYSARASYF